MTFRLVATAGILALSTGAGAFDAPVVVDGWTQERVLARMVPAQPRPGQVVIVEAPGYLRREQVWDGAPIALWRGRPQHVEPLVYRQDGEGPRSLVRWERPFAVVLDGALAEDAGVVARVRHVLAGIEELTGLPLTIAAEGTCVLRIDARLRSARSSAETTLHLRGPVITRATVRFRSRDDLLDERVLRHELGHVMGLGHSADPGDVMGDCAARADAPWFRPHEAIALHMMYAHREPGNLPGDRAALTDGGGAPGRGSAQGQPAHAPAGRGVDRVDDGGRDGRVRRLAHP